MFLLQSPNTGLIILMLKYQLAQQIPGVEMKKRHHPFACNEEIHNRAIQPQAYQQQINVWKL